MPPQMSRILQGVIMPKSDVLYFSTESKLTTTNVFCVKAKRQQQTLSVAKAKRQLQLLEK